MSYHLLLYSMKIEINNATKEKIDIDLLEEITKKFLIKYQKEDKEVSIAFVGEDEIRKMNKEYRGLDKVTDVLSFEGDNSFLGEIIICPEQIKRQAKELGNSEKYEIIFILVHGLLHLLGYDDESKQGNQEMQKLGKEFLAELDLQYD